jgi:hypothetical protein
MEPSSVHLLGDTLGTSLALILGRCDGDPDGTELGDALGASDGAVLRSTRWCHAR